jgi:hypothetical protein
VGIIFCPNEEPRHNKRKVFNCSDDDGGAVMAMVVIMRNGLRGITAK